MEYEFGNRVREWLSFGLRITAVWKIWRGECGGIVK